ncbi:MAG: hypothetical protein NUV63_10785 [Gallionella sp.]|nr:hypothetical protein [Gallionella sp.]
MTTAHTWNFFRVGGFDQVSLDSGAPCAPLDTGLTAGQFILSLSKGRYDGDTICWPDQ